MTCLAIRYEIANIRCRLSHWCSPILIVAKKPPDYGKAEQEAEQAKLTLMATAAKQKLASERMSSPKFGRQDPEFDSKLSKYIRPAIFKTPSTEHEPLVISSSNKSK
jgi:hypothetical protein